MVGTSFKTAYMQIYVLSDELTTVPTTMSIATTAQGPSEVEKESVPPKQPTERRTETETVILH